MDKQKFTVDFKSVDWETVDREKAELIYSEAVACHKEILEHINVVNGKASNLFSFFLPVETALVAFILFNYGKMPLPLFYAAACAVAFLFIILFLLLWIVLPRPLKPVQGEPYTFFADSFYKRDLKSMYIGKIVYAHNCIRTNSAVMNKRGLLLKISLVLSVCFPLISFLVFAVCLAVN